MTAPTVVTRFWFTVDRRGVDECWPWTGYVEKGYGRFFDGERMRMAHDLALEWWSGEARLVGLITCHSCNNPICVNPLHLRYDTPASNVADMMIAGAHNPSKKLSDDDVVAIRNRARAGATGKGLASRYGVSESLITMIITGKRRADVGGPIRTNHGNKKEAAHHG